MGEGSQGKHLLVWSCCFIYADFFPRYKEGIMYIGKKTDWHVCAYQLPLRIRVVACAVKTFFKQKWIHN